MLCVTSSCPGFSFIILIFQVCDGWSASGKKNVFGTVVDITEMQSEAGVAGKCFSSLSWMLFNCCERICNDAYVS